MIGIINCGLGNIGAVKNAVEFLGYSYELIDSHRKLENAEKIIFPGMGSFGAAVKNLDNLNLFSGLKTQILKGKPYLGICLGMQLLFEGSEESPGAKGLEIFSGKVKRFENESGKVPQVGWNEVKLDGNENGLLQEGFYYFANSYVVKLLEDDFIKNCEFGTTSYGTDFISFIRKGNIFATQFHPEKSGELGINFLRKWLEC